MTDQELRKLRRRDLLQLLLLQSEETDRLEAELAKTKQAEEDLRLALKQQRDSESAGEELAAEYRSWYYKIRDELAEKDEELERCRAELKKKDAALREIRARLTERAERPRELLRRVAHGFQRK